MFLCSMQVMACTFDAHDEWHLDVHPVDRLDHPLGDSVTPHNASKDVDQDRLHLRAPITKVPRRDTKPEVA